MLLGADPEQLHTTAVRFKGSSGTLEASRAAVNGAVAAAWWVGPVATNFRQDWQSRLAPLLTTNAKMLAALGRELEVQRQQQIDASRGESAGDGSGFANGVKDLIATGLSIAQVAEKVLEETRIVQVAGYLRASGKWVAPYVRWAPGTAEEMSQLFGSAARVAEIGKHLDKLGWAAVAINTAQQAYDDWGKYAADEYTGRVATRALIEGGVNWGATALAGAAAGAWGGPAGMAVGILVVGGWAIFTHTDFGKGVVDGLVDAGGWVGDKVGDLVGGAGDVLGDVGDALCFWD